MPTESARVVLRRTAIEPDGIVARGVFADREILVRLHPLDLEARIEQRVENLRDFLRQPAVYHKHAVVHRMIEAYVIEMDGNKIGERNRAALIPRASFHPVLLASRKGLDTGPECRGRRGTSSCRTQQAQREY
jgi:hypothetical protein